MNTQETKDTLIDGFPSSEAAQFDEFQDGGRFPTSGISGHDDASVGRQVRVQVLQHLAEEPVPADEERLGLALGYFEEQRLKDPLRLRLLAVLGELNCKTMLFLF